ncbi:putative acyltransferase [Sphingomonas jinjuensis]|uniref:Putative acyltransferase n=1 Tax=Sphingomonas jinjuensis TaxID=535907 RepID=A0A840F8Z0_9SPHN|nr:heparan-alpha-glucosaminide N-acetyltransferase domain-containing protein [Sphingomonas jinjuensis]MBB4153082.1 putative acyltransferase [Sphingomonas jinjuensis]
MTARRFTSLDVFRGLTVALMIVVNTAGPGAPAYATLVHARWIGFALADLVFPSFLFAVGSALAFVRLADRPWPPFLIAVARRSAIMFALGVLMYWFPFTSPFAETRIPGVLQRIALCYALAAIACRVLGWRGLLALSAVLLIGHWLILLLASPPGMAFDKMGNAGTRFDLWLIGKAHLYRKDGGFDPEGLLGTVPATVNVIAGYLAARGIRRGIGMRTLVWMGLALIVAALCWAGMLPIAKKLWSGSFVLLTVGIDLCALALLVKLVEPRPDNAMVRFFLVFGRNPLAIYLFSELLVIALRLLPAPDPYQWVGVNVFQQLAPGAPGSLLCAIAYTGICWLFGWLLARRGIMLRI